MAYTSLFTVLTDPELDGGVLPQAADLAAQLQAHLEVLCLGSTAARAAITSPAPMR